MIPSPAKEKAKLASPSSARQNGSIAKQAKMASVAATKKRAATKPTKKQAKKTNDNKAAGKEGKPTKKRNKVTQAVAEMAATANNSGAIANGFCSPSSLSASSLLPHIPSATACSFPMSRVWRLVRTEDASTRTTNDAVFLINKASELFLEKLAEDVYLNGLKECKISVSYNNLSALHNRKRYEFLSDFVPQRVTAEEASKARALMQS